MAGVKWKTKDLNKIDRNRILAKLTKGTKSKYKNKKVVVDGIAFDSTKEKNQYLILKQMRDKGKIVDLECQKVFKLEVNGKLVCMYIADFSFMQNNVHVVQDVKGYRKGGAYAIFRIKAKLLEALTGITIVEI